MRYRIPSLTDLTIGTVIVLFHVALSRSHKPPRDPIQPAVLADGSRVWHTQISP